MKVKSLSKSRNWERNLFKISSIFPDLYGEEVTQSLRQDQLPRLGVPSCSEGLRLAFIERRQTRGTRAVRARNFHSSDDRALSTGDPETCIDVDVVEQSNKFDDWDDEISDIITREDAWTEHGDGKDNKS